MWLVGKWIALSFRIEEILNITVNSSYYRVRIFYSFKQLSEHSHTAISWEYETNSILPFMNRERIFECFDSIMINNCIQELYFLFKFTMACHFYISVWCALIVMFIIEFHIFCAYYNILFTKFIFHEVSIVVNEYWSVYKQKYLFLPNFPHFLIISPLSLSVDSDELRKQIKLFFT